MIVHLHQLIVSITTTDLVAAEDGGRGEAGDGHAGLGGPELVVGVAAVLAEHGALGELEGEGVAGPLLVILQYSTVEHSTVQYSTVPGWSPQYCPGAGRPWSR